MSLSKDEQAIWDRFALACGNTTRNWAQLEYYLIRHLGHLLKTDEFRARIIWATMSNIRGRFMLLQRLGDTFLPTLTNREFKRLIHRAKKLQAKRNLVAHAFWVSMEGKHFTFYSDTDPAEEDEGFHFGKEETFQLSNVENWPDDIMAIMNGFADLLSHLAKDAHALPKTHFSRPHGLRPRSVRRRGAKTPAGH